MSPKFLFKINNKKLAVNANNEFEVYLFIIIYALNAKQSMHKNKIIKEDNSIENPI